METKFPGPPDSDRKGRDSSTGTHEKLGAHDARLAAIETGLLQVNARLSAQDQMLADIKELVAMAKGGLGLLTKLGGFVLFVASMWRLGLSIVSAMRSKP